MITRVCVALTTVTTVVAVSTLAPIETPLDPANATAHGFVLVRGTPTDDDSATEDDIRSYSERLGTLVAQTLARPPLALHLEGDADRRVRQRVDGLGLGAVVLGHAAHVLHLRHGPHEGQEDRQLDDPVDQVERDRTPAGQALAPTDKLLLQVTGNFGVEGKERFFAIPDGSTITVCPAGPPACDYTSIQAGVSAASAGDTVLVGANMEESGNGDPDDDSASEAGAVYVFTRTDTAWTQQPLTNDAPAILAALERLLARIAEGTRLDLALEEAVRNAEGPGRRGDNQPIAILLTDGLPNRVPTPAPAGSQADTVVRVAAQARSRGLRLFTGGLGEPDDVLRPLLEACASEPSMYYYAPDGEDLVAIYRAIAGRIVGCP